MTRAIARAAAMAALVLGLAPAEAAAQAQAESAAPEPRWTVAGAAGIQIHYDGTAQSLAFGFAPDRNLTILVTAERSSIDDRVRVFVDGYSAERGGTEQFVSGEVRYAFLARQRVSPYVLGGIGRGTSRPNVNDTFPDRKVRNVQVLYYGGGARIPMGRRFDAFADVRLIMSVEGRSDYFGVRMPVRAGIAWRF